MKRQWLMGGVTAIVGLLLSTATAGAVSTPDRNGNYTQRNATRLGILNGAWLLLIPKV